MCVCACQCKRGVECVQHEMSAFEWYEYHGTRMYACTRVCKWVFLHNITSNPLSSRPGNCFSRVLLSFFRSVPPTMLDCPVENGFLNILIDFIKFALLHSYGLHTCSQSKPRQYILVYVNFTRLTEDLITCISQDLIFVWHFPISTGNVLTGRRKRKTTFKPLPILP